MRFALLSIIGLVVAAPAWTDAPKNPPNICEFVAHYAGTDKPVISSDRHALESVTFEDLLQDIVLADVDGDGDMETLTIGHRGGTMRGRNLSYEGLAKARTQGAPIGYEMFPDVWEDYVRWGFDGAWLYYGDKWFGIRFHNETRQSVISIVSFSPEGEIPECAFDVNFAASVERYTPDNGPDQCSVIRDASTDNRPLASGAPLSSADIAFLKASYEPNFNQAKDGDLRSIEKYVAVDRALYTIDTDNDGAEERLVRIDYASGAGRGCDATYFELLPDEGQGAPNAGKRQALLDRQGYREKGYRHPFPCGSFSDWVDLGEETGLLRRQHTFGGQENSQYVSLIKGGQDISVCKTEYTPVHTIAFDRSAVEANPSLETP